MIQFLSWTASVWLHLSAASLAIMVWPILLIAFWLSGIPSHNVFSFKWDNPYHRGPSTEDDSQEDVVLIYPPRRFRPLPEMERPHVEEAWDSRRIPFDEDLGAPSPFETSFPGPTSSGFMKAKGDSLDFVSDKPFRGKGTYDTFGVSGGGGGRYGSKVVLKDAVQLGLVWLARHQKEDGSWSRGGLGRQCGRPLPNGRQVTGSPCESEQGDDEADRTTALAAMAFAGAGYLPNCPDVWDGIRYREVVGRACRFLSRPGRPAQARMSALLALASLMRPPSPFDPPERKEGTLPDPTTTRELLASAEADPFPAEGSDAAAWAALAFVSAARVGLDVSPAALQRAEDELQRRCQRFPSLEPAAWPGENLASTYLRLLASYEESSARRAALPSEKALYPRLRGGQSREADACREGSWEPVETESRLTTTLLHLLALESLPGYGFRGGHALRPATDPAELEIQAHAERLRAMARKRKESVRAVPGALRRGIQRVRDAYPKRGDVNIEGIVREAFEPVELTYVRHVPKVEIGDHLESDNDEEFQRFKPLTRLGGRRDLLTEEVHRGLCQGEGIVGFNGALDLVVPDKKDDLTSLGRTLIFALRDGTTRADGTPHWEAYVVIGFPW